MNSRRIAQVVLLTVVVATLAVVFWPRQPGSSTPPPQASVQTGISYAAYYFHGNIRCETCRAIESQAKTAIQSGFDNELATGMLEWRGVNIDLPENAHFRTEFGLTHSTLVLIQRDEGQTKRFVSLDRVWELVEDKSAFRDYVQTELGNWLRSES